jgi:signal transduction histidine kinase
MLDYLQRRALKLRDSAFAFPLAVVVAGLMVVISEVGYRQASGRLTELVAMGQTRLQLARLGRRISDAESSKRGYMLTRRSDYLAPYKDASLDVADCLAQMRVLYQRTNDSAGQVDLKALDGMVSTKLSEMDEVLKLFKSGHEDAARELMMTDIGRDAMVNIRSLSDTMLARQNAQVAVGLTQVFNTLTLNRVGVSTMTAVSLLVLGMYLRQRRLADHERATRQRLVQAERDRLEVEVQHRTAELIDLAKHLETAREDERARLARDLHDELGALLTAAKLDVARMRPKLQQDAPELAPRLAHLIETLNSGIALKRRIIEDLRPSSLSNLGLLPALEILCAEFGERIGFGVQTQFSPVTLSASSDLTLFRLVQESLNNIAKHAQAQSITVEVAEREGQAWVSVVDDGVGFDSGAVRLARHGLVGMRYRVQAEGGQLEVRSAPGQGTRVQARLPLQHNGGAAPGAGL